MNPYVILGVSSEVGDAAIRNAYLESIKLATPEKDPRRFQQLTEAYEKIKDESQRYRHELFNKDTPGTSPLDVLVRRLHWQPAVPPLTLDAMKELLRACSKT
jgi:hypothetical protein